VASSCILLEESGVMWFFYVFRICFCTADRAHERVFAYVARNRENETMECHAFLCPKRKIVSNMLYSAASHLQNDQLCVEWD